MTIVLYRDTDTQWRWRLVSNNGEIIATGEGHRRKWNAKRAALRVSPDAIVVTERAP